MAKERLRFVLEWEKRWNAGEGRMNFAELCREFGISRQGGYVWLRRYREADRRVDAVVERSRRPKTMPTKVSEDVEEFLIAIRKAHPTWGPRKLHAWILHHRPDVELPAHSTIAEVLRRRGMTVSPRRRTRPSHAMTKPFAKIEGPNATWCVDFKGQFPTKDGIRCYPLTILDAYSRLLIRCEGVVAPDGREVQRIFDSAFQEFGLPAAIRSDNGPPFSSVGAGGLTKLAVWWLRLGISVERITPGRPQENGRQERFHRTLKAETASPPHADLRAQQRAFDIFRRVYNHERPHEALGQKPPSSAYATSARRYPRPLVRFQVDPWNHAVLVDKHGFVLWNSERLFISTALAHENIDVRFDSDQDHWDLVFGPLSLGVLRETPRGPRFVPSLGRIADLREVLVE